ncbi:MAG: hypothetical protein DRN90_08155 [Thermoproteota archaeon]|nr:MAG: hypothetical protein DRO05_06230 [Candidatus Korarchaeota archaeon]RLG45027.1 MAG: hypothetical protein DRN90_08155 [Candidatus Korarchaeota archaeon]
MEYEDLPYLTTLKRSLLIRFVDRTGVEDGERKVIFTRNTWLIHPSSKAFPLEQPLLPVK